MWNAERAWSYGMQLKACGRAHSHAKGRFAKAVKYASNAHVDASYLTWIRANYDLECERWKEALLGFRDAMTLDFARDRAIVFIRYCEHQLNRQGVSIPSKAAEPLILSMKHLDVEDMLKPELLIFPNPKNAVKKLPSRSLAHRLALKALNKGLHRHWKACRRLSLKAAEACADQEKRLQHKCEQMATISRLHIQHPLELFTWKKPKLAPVPRSPHLVDLVGDSLVKPQPMNISTSTRSLIGGLLSSIWRR